MEDFKASHYTFLSPFYQLIEVTRVFNFNPPENEQSDNEDIYTISDKEFKLYHFNSTSDIDSNANLYIICTNKENKPMPWVNFEISVNFKKLELPVTYFYSYIDCKYQKV